MSSFWEDLEVWEKLESKFFNKRSNVRRNANSIDNYIHPDQIMYVHSKMSNKGILEDS